MQTGIGCGYVRTSGTNSHGDDDEIWRRVKLGKRMLVRRGSGTRKLSFRRGDVYTLGSLTGLWAGRMLVSVRSVYVWLGWYLSLRKREKNQPLTFFLNMLC